MRRQNILLALLMLLALLAGCSGNTVPQETETTMPEITRPPMADIGGTLLELGTESLDLEQMTFTFDKLIAASAELHQVSSISLGTTDLSSQQIAGIREAYPEAQIDYSIDLFGEIVDMDTQYLDLSSISAEQTDALVAALPLLPSLREINFVSDEGICPYTAESISELDKIRETAPEVYLRIRFELFGQIVSSEDERIEYYCVEIGNEGIETVRGVLPYLRGCTYLLMDGCGVDNEVMAMLREDFPEIKIVWRVWLMDVNYNSKLALRTGSYLTDTYRIRTTYVNDSNSHVLNYCTETKYVDVGHVWNLSQCDFLAYMPDLEVCIIAITGITNIEPLANHEKLEYLELFTTDIEDLSPLASCPNLEHLNISNMPRVSDISPLYGLTKLKRLRMVRSPLIPEEQKEEIALRLPECTILNRGDFPTSHGWRYTDAAGKVKDERYALLCEQMEYTKDAVEYGIP